MKKNAKVSLALVASLFAGTVVADEIREFTAECESLEVHRYDVLTIWDGSNKRYWSDDEKCCSVTVVYTGGDTIELNDREIPLVALTKFGHMVAIDVTNVGWEAGIWSYAIKPELEELVATEVKAYGLEPQLRARAVQYECKFIFH